MDEPTDNNIPDAPNPAGGLLIFNEACISSWAGHHHDLLAASERSRWCDWVTNNIWTLPYMLNHEALCKCKGFCHAPRTKRKLQLAYLLHRQSGSMFLRLCAAALMRFGIPLRPLLLLQGSLTLCRTPRPQGTQ